MLRRVLDHISESRFFRARLRDLRYPCTALELATERLDLAERYSAQGIWCDAGLEEVIQKEAASFFFPSSSHHFHRKLYIFMPLGREVLPDVVD